MQTETADRSCTISIAEDGEVGFLVSNAAVTVGEPCSVRISGDTLSIRQGDTGIVTVEGVSPEFADAIRAAPGLCLVNILDPGKPTEHMSLNRQLTLD